MPLLAPNPGANRFEMQRQFEDGFILLPLTHRYHTCNSQMDRLANVHGAAVHALPKLLGVTSIKAPLVTVFGGPEVERLQHMDAIHCLPLPNAPATLPTAPRALVVTDYEIQELREFDDRKLFHSPMGFIRANAKSSQIGDLVQIEAYRTELGISDKDIIVSDRDILIVISWMREVGMLLHKSWRSHTMIRNVLYFDADGLYKAIYLFLRLMRTPTFVCTASSIPAVAATCLSLHIKLMCRMGDYQFGVVPPALDGVLAYLAQVPTSELLFVEQFVLRCIVDDPEDRCIPGVQQAWIEFLGTGAHHLQAQNFDQEMYWSLFDRIVTHEILPLHAWYTCFALGDPTSTTPTASMKEDYNRTNFLFRPRHLVSKVYSVQFAQILDICVQKMEEINEEEADQWVREQDVQGMDFDKASMLKGVFVSLADDAFPHEYV